MTSVRKAEQKQQEKLRFVPPIWPLVAFVAIIGLAVWLLSR